MRQVLGSVRQSALWGKPSKGEYRSSALWGKGGRGLLATFVLAAAFAAPVAATASASGSAADSGNYGRELTAFVSPELLDAARANPCQVFKVIVQSRGSVGSVASDVDEAADETSTRRDALKRRFSRMGSVSAELTGRAILRLARQKNVLAITPDAPVVLSSYSNTEAWPLAANVAKLWRSNAQAPTIAVVDSGIEKDRADFDFGARVIDTQVMTQLQPNSPDDGRGHGTFVAGIAAGSAHGRAGAAPNANIVMIDVMDDHGMAMTSDVIAAAEWIYQNREAKNIRVVNFSLHSASPASIMWDPLDAAVEKLWFGGVVVVAAAGNYGVPGGPSGVGYAPGNDPFIITVGAVDIDGSPRRTIDDQAAPWSA
ncbi:MAG: S8 family serine peptidase, partial [Gaiellaceae bacterium]